MAGTDGVSNLDADTLNKFLSLASKKKVTMKTCTAYFTGGTCTLSSLLAPAAQNMDGFAVATQVAGQAIYNISFTGAFSEYPAVFYQIQRSGNSSSSAQPIFVQGLKDTDAGMKTGVKFGFFLNSTGALLTGANVATYVTDLYLHVTAIGVV